MTRRGEEKEVMTRAVVYARYSSDNQRDASIEDQVRQCRARIEQEGWQIAEIYSDHAISGATTLRPGYQKMLEDARAGRFDVLVAEALDRLSRDQENIAGLFKQLSFAGVRLITLSEGEIGELHVGLKGTMNALFLKDLAHKTRRGLEGRVRQGKSGGGLCFGYDVVRKLDAAGEAVHGERRINDGEAAIVRRIFQQCADGRSPRAIAQSLNKEGIPGPAGRSWALPRFMATGGAARAFSTMSFISAGWFGIASSSPKTQIPESGRHDPTRKPTGSLRMCPISGSSKTISGTGLKSGSRNPALAS
jgi:DNA invertase Pin-like site-specific DNA recombinase